MSCVFPALLGIYYTVSERCRANITQWLIRVPVVGHYAHVGVVQLSVAVKVNDWNDWHLP